MAEAPTPELEFMVGWEFLVLRHSWRRSYVRLRAMYKHSSKPLEVVVESWDAGYFEAKP